MSNPCATLVYRSNMKIFLDIDPTWKVQVIIIATVSFVIQDDLASQINAEWSFDNYIESSRA